MQSSRSGHSAQQRAHRRLASQLSSHVEAKSVQKEVLEKLGKCTLCHGQLHYCNECRKEVARVFAVNKQYEYEAQSAANKFTNTFRDGLDNRSTFKQITAQLLECTGTDFAEAPLGRKQKFFDLVKNELSKHTEREDVHAKWVNACDRQGRAARERFFHNSSLMSRLERREQFCPQSAIHEEIDAAGALSTSAYSTANLQARLAKEVQHRRFL